MGGLSFRRRAGRPTQAEGALRSIILIGIGAGDPDHLTLGAVKALNRVQVLFVPDKGEGKEELRRIRRDIVDRHVADGRVRTVEFAALRRRADIAGYEETVAEWHGRIADQYAGLLRRELRDGEAGGFLVWGDPSLYDSTLRIMETIEARGTLALEVEVIPGITSVQALAARHRVALNRVGGPVHITTGRRLAGAEMDAVDDAVVMLDGEGAFARLDGERFDIFWGAYLGTADEILVAGKLSDVAAEIGRLRAEARARKGWVMDTYLLKRRAPR